MTDTMRKNGQQYHTEPLAWLNHDGRTLAISRNRPAWAVVNATAAAIVKFCTALRGRSLEEIHSWFEARYGAVESDECRGWLDDLESNGLIRRGAEFPAPTVAPPDYDAYRVEHMYIELLARCNLRCIHCFMGGSPDRTEQLEPDLVFQLIDDLAESGGRYVTLAGGEPLIYRHFAEVVRHVAARGLYGTVITNGLSLKSHHLDLLDELGFNLAISLDGITSEVNELIRGTGSARVIASIDRALDRLGSDRVILSFTPVKANLGELDALFNFVEERGIKRLNLSIYEEVGRASEHAAVLTLDESDKQRLMRFVYTKAVELAGRVEIDLNDTRDVLSQFSADRRIEELHPLWRGVRVTSEGDVYPASFGAVEQFRLGNVGQTRFADILRSPTLHELYDALQQRVARTPKCRECAWRQICRGGSVASAYCAHGELYAPDAYCEAYLDVFPGVAVALAELGIGTVAAKAVVVAR